MVNFFEREFESAIEDIQNDFERADRVADDFGMEVYNWTCEWHDELVDIDNGIFEGDVEPLVDSAQSLVRNAVNEVLDHINEYRVSYYEVEAILEDLLRDEIHSRGHGVFLDYLP